MNAQSWMLVGAHLGWKAVLESGNPHAQRGEIRCVAVERVSEQSGVKTCSNKKERIELWVW